MGKIEKTLELNITHELITLADSYKWYLTNISLKRYWRPSWRWPFFSPSPTYATGISILEEGKPGGGWDVCIKSPGYKKSEKLVFIQFKAGEHKSFSTRTSSIFNGSRSSPKPHILFGFNNNSARNQHQLLAELASNHKDAGHPVLYAFPRIITETDLIENLGRLCHKTSFISVADMDHTAAKSGMTISPGIAHKLRADYDSYEKYEIESDPIAFAGPDYGGEFMGEFIASRMERALKEYQQYSEELEVKIEMIYIIQSFIQYVRHLLEYFELSISQEIELLNSYFSLSSEGLKSDDGNPVSKLWKQAVVEFKQEKRSDSIFKEKGLRAETESRKRFYQILESIKIFFEIFDKKEFDSSIQIPEVPAQFSFQIVGEELRIPMQSDHAPEDLEGMGYTLF